MFIEIIILFVLLLFYFSVANSHDNNNWLRALVFLRFLLYYFFTSFTIEENRLTKSSGLLVKRSKTIGFDRVQNAEVTQGIFMKIFGLSEIDIWTASPEQVRIEKGTSDNHPDISFILEGGDGEWLKNLVFSKKPS